MVKLRQSGEAQTPTILVSDRRIMAQPTFRLGVNDVRAGRPIGTMSAADVLPSSHHIDSRCGSTASSTRRPFGFSGNAAGQSDEQPKAIATRCLRGKVGEDRKMTVETDHAKTQAN
jgi:hypothetical protein